MVILFPRGMKIVSIIIPVFNEKNTIQSVISMVKKINIPNFRKQIVVVDDGSTDGTGEILEKIANIVLIKLAVNSGKGAAVRAAFKQISGDLVLIQDADLEYSPDNYTQLLKPFENSRVKVVYGSRFLGSHLSTMYVYEIGNKFVTLLCNILFNTNITDMETGYKVFRKSVIDSIDLTSNRFDFEPEVTAKILKKGIQIYETPITYYGRTFSEGKKLTWKDGVIAVGVLLSIRMQT